MTEKKMIGLVDKAFQEASIVGKVLKDVYFYDDQPFLDKNWMLSIYNNHVTTYPWHASRIRMEDIPDDFITSRGLSTYEIKFLLLFSDDTAISFLLNGNKTEIRYIPKNELSLPERENNINEHMMFDPVFGRTIASYRAWCYIPYRSRELRIEISFVEGMMLYLSSSGMYIMEKKGCPLGVSNEELRKMIPHYEDYFDDELVQHESKTQVAMIWKGKLEDDNSVSSRLIRKLFDLKCEPRMAETIMRCLETEEEMQYLLDLADSKEEKILSKLIHAAVDIDEQRE